MSMREMIYNGFLFTYIFFLFMELLALLIPDVAFVLVIRSANYGLIGFCYYLREVSFKSEGGNGRGRRFLLYQSLLWKFVVGDSLLYGLVFWFTSLYLFVSFSFLVGLARAFYEYGYVTWKIQPREQETT